MSGQGEEENGEKPFDPTHKKLEDQRRKGDVPRSADLIMTAAYGGFLLSMVMFGSFVIERAGTAMLVTIDRADTLAPLFLTGGSGLPGGFIGTISLALLPLFLLPAGIALASVFAQNAFTVSPDKLKPKLSKVSLIANAKQKFGRNGLFEFAKSLVKLVVISVVLWLYLLTVLPEILATARTSAGQVSLAMGQLTIRFLVVVLLISLVIGAIDYLWQRTEHIRRNRMSHKEITDETKQMEGDPHLKQKRRQRGYDIATNRMLADVPGADVVVVNPEHYAVALKWSRRKGEAPVCVAKGVDEVAARIRETAEAAGIPLHRDAPTARALHASVEIGQEIDARHYKAVAAAIRFADKMRAHRRRGN